MEVWGHRVLSRGTLGVWGLGCGASEEKRSGVEKSREFGGLGFRLYIGFKISYRVYIGFISGLYRV